MRIRGNAVRDQFGTKLGLEHNKAPTVSEGLNMGR